MYLYCIMFREKKPNSFLLAVLLKKKAISRVYDPIQNMVVV